MDATTDILQGRWHELKGGVKQRWAKLTDEEVANLSGQQAELATALQTHYGYAEVQANMEIARWVSDYDKGYTRA